MLYADVFKISYPRGFVKWQDKAEYLLKQGWLDYKDEESRNKFLKELKEENEKKQNEENERIKRAQMNAQRRDSILWLLTWITPVILLFILTVYLLILNHRQKSPVITSKTFDRIIVYIIYGAALGVAIYLFYPYLGIKTVSENRTDKEYKEKVAKALNEIAQLETLRFFDYQIRSIRPLFHSYGIGAFYDFIDKRTSRLDIEYLFTLMIEPESETYKVRLPRIQPAEAIKRLESNELVFSFLENTEINQALLSIFGTILVVESIDKKYQIKYDSKQNSVTGYTVPSFLTNLLVGAYSPPTQECFRYALYYNVDLETGAMFGPVTY